MQGLILSRLDYANALYYGLPDSLIQKLQYVQNAVARLVCQVKKYDHITPVLKLLQWLPVWQRIEFKILLITFKAVNGCIYPLVPYGLTQKTCLCQEPDTNSLGIGNSV